jgi:hypothetical protein
MTNDNPQTNRVDPVDEVKFILRTYPRPALNLFKMTLGLALSTAFQPGRAGRTSRTGSVEKAVYRIQRMLQAHPEQDIKRAAIRALLGMA